MKLNLTQPTHIYLAVRKHWRSLSYYLLLYCLLEERCLNCTWKTCITISGVPSSNKVHKIDAFLGCRICPLVRSDPSLFSGRFSIKFWYGEIKVD